MAHLLLTEPSETTVAAHKRVSAGHLIIEAHTSFALLTILIPKCGQVTQSNHLDTLEVYVEGVDVA